MSQYSDQTTVKILLVEDNAADQALTKRALAQKNFASELFIVSDGEAALDYMYKRGEHEDSISPDIILLDLNLPKISGAEFLEKIRKDPNLGHTPVIVMTTSEDPYDVKRVYKAGGNSYITKPVQFTDFISALGQIGDYWLQLVELPESIKKVK